MTYNKYGNKFAYVDGHVFHSIKEKNRYLELKLMERGDLICDIEIQPRFLLQEGFTDFSNKKHRPIYYFADFRYYDNQLQNFVVEDVKSRGTLTAIYKLKKKMLLFTYPEIVFREIY